MSEEIKCPSCDGETRKGKIVFDDGTPEGTVIVCKDCLRMIQIE